MEAEEIQTRLEKLEKANRGGLRFFMQYLISPLLLLVIGFALNAQVEKAKREFQELEVQIKQIEAAQDMLAELFSDIPERAFIADRLMAQLVDEKLSKEISGIVTRYYSEKLGRNLNGEAVQEAQRIADAARAVGGPAAEQVIAQLRDKRYYVVVASVAERHLDQAVALAESLRKIGYKSQVHRTGNEYLAVTLGRYPLESAEEVRLKAIESEEIGADAFLTEGETFVSQLYPVNGEPSAGADG